MQDNVSPIFVDYFFVFHRRRVRLDRWTRRRTREPGTEDRNALRMALQYRLQAGKYLRNNRLRGTRSAAGVGEHRARLVRGI